MVWVEGLKQTLKESIMMKTLKRLKHLYDQLRESSKGYIWMFIMLIGMYVYFGCPPL